MAQDTLPLHKPLRAAVYEGPPAREYDLDMNLPRKQIIDCRNGMDCDE